MSEMHRPQWIPHMKVVEHEHQVLVLFQLLTSPHQGREERYVRWWPIHRLFQWPLKSIYLFTLTSLIHRLLDYNNK